MSDKLTEVRLLSVPLENDYKHTLYFSSVTAQANYFDSKKVFYGSAFTYIRKDNVLRYPRDYDELEGHVNYMMYKNSSHSDKWFYAFITEIKYVNDGMSEIKFETDVIQTWLFDFYVKPSFIEREHVDNDEIGLHTIDEELDKGSYICNSHTMDEKLRTTEVVMASTVYPIEMHEKVGGVYGGIYSGVKYYSFSLDKTTEYLQGITDKFGTEAVTSLFIAPQFLLGDLEDYQAPNEIPNSTSPAYYTVAVGKTLSSNFRGQYIPKNNKLYTSPYCYLLVTNGNGGSAIYNYEDFENASCEFRVDGVLCSGCSIRMIPLNYKGIASNFDEGLNMGKYPQCNWATDTYINWLTQNGVNVATSIVNAGVSAVGGALVGGTVGAITGAVSGLTQIANTLNEKKKADMQPPQVRGNTNNGDVITSARDNTYHFYKMSIKPEYAKIIDEYLSMFGYKCHRVKYPNWNHRANYWYTKTIDANIDGALPMPDMKKIKEVYNNGITFWKNPNNIQDYSVNNSIIE